MGFNTEKVKKVGKTINDSYCLVLNIRIVVQIKTFVFYWVLVILM